MTQDILHAAAPGGLRDIRISDWIPYNKGTLRAFFSLTLPSGLVIRRVMLHEQGAARWVQTPSREWLDTQGKKGYAPLIEFTSRDVSDRFKEQVLHAVDRYLTAHGSPEFEAFK
jgi:hypothetical protein